MRRAGKIKGTFASSVKASGTKPTEGSSSTMQNRKQERVSGAYKRGGAVRGKKSKTMPDGVEGTTPSAYSPSASAGAGSSPASAPKKRASGGPVFTAGAGSGAGRLQLGKAAAKRMK